MSENFLSEAFKDLEIIQDGTFDFDKKGAEELKAFLDGDNLNDFEPIIDSEAETEEEIKDSYVGDVILSCNVCHSMLYKKPEEVIVDEASEDVNIDEECPLCASTNGYKVVGQVAEYKPETHTHEEDEEKIKVDVDGEEIKDTENVEVEESFKNKRSSLKESSKRDDIDADADDKKEKAKKAFMKKKDDADSDKDYKLKKAGMKEPDQLNEESNIAKLKKAFPELDISENLKESDEKASASIEDCQKYVDYDMKHYGKISDKTNEIVKKAGFQIIKDQYGDYEVAARDYEKPLKEDFQKVEIETDTEKMSMTADENGKTTVTTEPKHDVVDNKEEVIAPVSDEVKAKIEDKEEIEEPTFDEEEIDIDEFDEESFDELGESYLKKVYDNVDSYKTTKAKVNENKLMLEGVIKFNSGKEAKTNFLFEASHKTTKGKLKFKGYNKQITESRNSFIITGSMSGKKLLTEALTYNYKVKGSKDRIYGTIKK